MIRGILIIQPQGDEEDPPISSPAPADTYIIGGRSWKVKIIEVDKAELLGNGEDFLSFCISQSGCWASLRDQINPKDEERGIISMKEGCPIFLLFLQPDMEGRSIVNKPMENMKTSGVAVVKWCLLRISNDTNGEAVLSSVKHSLL